MFTVRVVRVFPGTLQRKFVPQTLFVVNRTAHTQTHKTSPKPTSDSRRQVKQSREQTPNPKDVGQTHSPEQTRQTNDMGQIHSPERTRQANDMGQTHSQNQTQTIVSPEVLRITGRTRPLYAFYLRHHMGIKISVVMCGLFWFFGFKTFIVFALKTIIAVGLLGGLLFRIVSSYRRSKCHVYNDFIRTLNENRGQIEDVIGFFFSWGCLSLTRVHGIHRTEQNQFICGG
eukprot:TRINITY_DN5808_c0_g1_i13.p1 TRINITY_DN5808_c0_g1~~TRINITY_DN5808_c0_g1_i13.p1  ORF type:complete len:229 (+),score=21.90 TRINITY_DN5808_c0_g1_i13:327-1013(+)